MHNGHGYGSISSSASSNGYSGGLNGSGGSSRRREAEDRDRSRMGRSASGSLMGDDLDITAILKATSISSITGMSQNNRHQHHNKHHQKHTTEREKEKEKVVDRGKGKGKEKVDTRDSGPRGFVSDLKSTSTEPIFHPISTSDTLEGIALKYDVQLADLKRVNRLFSNQDLFARKELVIPFPEEEVIEENRPRRSYEKDIKAAGRRSFENTPTYIYPGTPEEEVVGQTRSLLSDTGAGVKIKKMGEKVRKRLEDEEDSIYGL